MNAVNNNTKTKKYKHLTQIQRYKIEAHLDDNKTASQIAKLLGKSTRTIQREIKRGKVIQQDTYCRYIKKYSADASIRRHKKACKMKGPNLKIGNNFSLANELEKLIGKLKFSPDIALKQIKRHRLDIEVNICTKTLYNYIDRNLFLNISNDDLWEKNKRKRKYKRVKRCSYKNRLSKSIEMRPDDIDKRKEFGHWEMDCIVSSKNKGAALLVLSERKSRKEKIFKIDKKTQSAVIDVLDKEEKRLGKDVFKEIFKTITVDNGVEFLDSKGIEKDRTKLYYAHPYSSWERGTNENLNRMIRRFIPKKTNIGNIKEDTIKRLEMWLNNYPRKILDYKTPNEFCLENGFIGATL